MNRPAQSSVPESPAAERIARRIVIAGRVQGVGYRPFVYRIAEECEITGTVRNDTGKVLILVEGEGKAIDRFQSALIEQAPPLARPVIESWSVAAPSGVTAFTIEPSVRSADVDIHVPSDLFTCDECVAELNDKHNRRHRYPFINCTQCGPRYTIIETMPYDRPNTSMRDFPLCAACRHEYTDPRDRRYHAQPLACPDCGPSLEFVDAEMRSTGTEAAIAATVDALGRGAIVAIKGIGGYHLVCDAADDDAVRRLRQRKHRPHKPLAVLFPMNGADGLDAVRKVVSPTPDEALLISDPVRPIVLVRKRPDSGLSGALAPGLNELGVFLPYSPLHHILLQDLGRPVVATSGNLSGEPVITDPSEAIDRLAAVADAFLHHNRPILRPADDAVVRVIGNVARPIRLGRGTAPVELSLPDSVAVPTIAVGGHMKNTIALAWDRRVVVSSHVGDLDSPRSMAVFKLLIEDLQKLYGVSARRLVHDLHPAYASTRWAKQQPLPCRAVQHHRAHASALYGEHAAKGTWLVFAWDGTGFGDDGTLWGGEGFIGQPGNWRRVSSFRPFRLVGGDKTGREPWRSAAALTWETGQRWQPPLNGVALAEAAWHKNINAYQSTAAGRLFDAAAALVLERHFASFEGHGPMELESIAARHLNIGIKPLSLPMTTDENDLLRTDWRPLVEMLRDEQIPRPERAAGFHETMAQAIADQAERLRPETGVDTVGLTGGVFQNRRLCERVAEKLTALGFDVRLHRELPANDGGLCFGQIIETMAGDRQ